MLSKVSQKRQILYDLTNAESKKKKKNPKLTEMESRFLVGRGRGWEEQAKRVKEYRLPVLR